MQEEFVWAVQETASVSEWALENDLRSRHTVWALGMADFIRGRALDLDRSHFCSAGLGNGRSAKGGCAFGIGNVVVVGTSLVLDHRG
jgi:hypothetical protein